MPASKAGLLLPAFLSALALLILVVLVEAVGLVSVCSLAALATKDWAPAMIFFSAEMLPSSTSSPRFIPNPRFLIMKISSLQLIIQLKFMIDACVTSEYHGSANPNCQNKAICFC